MPRTPHIIIFLIIILALPVSLNGPSLFAGERLDLDGVLNAMDAATVDFESLQANITYTRSIFLLDEEEIAEGTLKYKKPRKMRLEFEPPRDEIDVSNGEFFWIYKPNEKQVEKYQLSGEETTELSFFEFGYEGSVDKAKENYFIESVPNSGTEGAKEDEGAYILKLIPKPSATQMPQYNEIVLWVDDSIWLPVRMEFYESDGEIINRIELWEIKVNEPLDDDIFQFEVPEGVEVVEPL
ncbi:MAG: outer membrane lipoprotein carrier protein LolA [Candidatus Brocadiales bacterium]